MNQRQHHPFVVAVITYPIAAWLFTGCLIAGAVLTGRTPDGSFWQAFFFAPLAVPLLVLHAPSPAMLIWLFCVLLTWLLAFRVLRRRMT